jgi:hypothetical protein
MGRFRVGASIAAVDLNGDTCDDMVIGMPWFGEAGTSTYGSELHNEMGMVAVLPCFNVPVPPGTPGYRAHSSLVSGGGLLREDDWSVVYLQTSQKGDLFGATMTGVYRDSDGYEDLFIGVPGQETEWGECGMPGYLAVEARGTGSGYQIYAW